MNRFRVTFIAVCCVLAWLAYTDLSLLLRNPEPLAISIYELETLPSAPQEWLRVEGGYPQLLRGINMTGGMEFTAFLIPLTSSPQSDHISIWFESRDPEILEALTTYYFLLDTRAQQEDFLLQNAHLFAAPRTVTGLITTNLVASSNQRQLMKLLAEMDHDTSQTPVFISEGKTPAVWRGIFYGLAALAGLLKVAYDQRSRLKSPA